MSLYRKYLSGFTIVELSAVLVILGLLTGGIVMGQTLIRASEIRSIVTQKEATVAAVYSFKDKFNGIPGDLKDAQNIWGAAADCVSVQTTTATCNGTGNGLLENQTASGTTGNENFLFWKHLANAGLIPGNYWGIQDGTQNYSTSANNVLSGKISNSLWYASRWNPQSGNATIFDGAYNNFLAFGIFASDSDPNNTVLTPSEMFALDRKIDDGSPGIGGLRARISSGCAVKADGVTAAVSSDATTALYNTSATGNKCRLVFPNAF